MKHFSFFQCLQRLYREDYHKQKDKIHTTYDTPDIKQVKMNQEHLSDVRSLQSMSLISGLMTVFNLWRSFVVCSFQLWYKEKYYNSRGHYISLPITPQLMHCYHVNEITSEV